MTARNKLLSAPPYPVEQGLKLGNNVADWDLSHYFQPVH